MELNNRLQSLNLFSNAQLIPSLMSLPLPAALRVHFYRMSMCTVTFLSAYMKCHFFLENRLTRWLALPGGVCGTYSAVEPRKLLFKELHTLRSCGMVH